MRLFFAVTKASIEQWPQEFKLRSRLSRCETVSPTERLRESKHLEHTSNPLKSVQCAQTVKIMRYRATQAVDSDGTVLLHRRFDNTLRQVRTDSIIS